MREIVKTVKHTVEEEELVFQIHKMNALDGSYLIKFVAEKLIPLFDSFQTAFTSGGEAETEEEIAEVAKKRSEAIVDILPKALSSISKEELHSFQKQCLNNVDMMKPAGWQRVMNGESFGVEEVEYDPMLSLILCYDVVEFNFSGFFGGGALSSLLPR